MKKNNTINYYNQPIGNSKIIINNENKKYYQLVNEKNVGSHCPGRNTLTVYNIHIVQINKEQLNEY